MKISSVARVNSFYFLITHDMDKMCNRSEVEDLNKTTTNSGEKEQLKNRGSPVFKCFNNAKTVRGNNLSSSDYDIPSYQVNNSVKCRTSSKYGNETNESVVPFSPIFSPIPIATSSAQFQPPTVHTISTIVKNIDRSCQNKVTNSSTHSREQSVKPNAIFDSLGMTDKDISWVSSMATPPPKNVPGSEFNTVEKATFFPEEKFQNIQPRALFSPTLDDDFGCHPIVFTSESDGDETDDEYKSNIRLSDVCATLKQLEVKSLDLIHNNSVEYVISPIIKTKKRKLESAKKKKKGPLVISPENNDKYKFAVGENLNGLDCEKVKSNSGANFIEDDSFQSMSFSGIDELCKTLVSEHSSTSRASKTADFDKTLTSIKESNVLKRFYCTKTTTDVFEVSSTENLHSYAKALEESDKCNQQVYKVNQPLPQTGIVRFDIMNKDTAKVGAKRSHSEITEENDEGAEKKFKKVEEEDSGWENVKHYLSESQLNISDGEIFRTVENLERTLASQESKLSEKLQGVESVSSQNSDLTMSCIEKKGKANELSNNEIPICSLEKSETNRTENSTKSSVERLQIIQSVALSTASGSRISVSEKALEKAREILEDCVENLEFDKKTFAPLLGPPDKNTEVAKSKEDTSEVLMRGFSTGTGKQIKVSAEALEKARLFMAECVVPESEKLNIQYHEESGDGLKRGFLTSSGKQIQVPDTALEKAKTLTSEFEDHYNVYERCPSTFKSAMAGFSTGSGKKIQVSAKALEKAKALMAECDKGQEDPWLKGSKMESKKAKTYNCDNNSKESLTKSTTSLIGVFARTSGDTNQKTENTLAKGEVVRELKTEKPKDNLNIFKGFSTGSGKIIPVSAEALEKAKALIKGCESELKENSGEFGTDWIGELDSKAFLDPMELDAKGSHFDNKVEEMKQDNICFSTASGNVVKVSKKALEKVKELWCTTVENIPEFSQTEPPLMDFATVGENKIPTSEADFTKGKERTNDWEQIKPEDSVTSDCVINRLKTSVKSGLEIETTKSERNPSKMSATSANEESDDWDEIIPSWLHVYSTSPSIAAERTELSPIICHEDGKSSKPDREYIVRSPVLGKGDRFHGRTKKRKLRFEEETKEQEKSLGSFIIPHRNLERKNSGKRSSNLSLDFSVPFKKMKFLGDTEVTHLDVKAERARAREEQEKSIRRKLKVKPLKGSHLSRKFKEKQISWKEAVAGSSPEVYSDEFLKNFGICEDVLRISIENADSVRFKGEYFFGPTCSNNTEGIPVGDECLLILDDDNKFGVEELKRAFLVSCGVQPNLVPQGWVENHLKWIIWKLANYEKCFPQYFVGRCLTPNNLMFQLKYRYDREIDRNERSALKKILERDDTSIKRLVLCICDIQKVMAGESVGYKLTLTDGWYSCPAHTDPAMSRLIEEGKLRIGTKLVTQGATLVNCEQGVSPLEIRGDVYLKISTNSTRRIRWDAKLGFQKNPGNFPISLGSILPQGGPISRIDVIIVRIYPTLYMEKTSDGRHVTRNRRSEEKADSEYRRIQEERMESICNEIQSEMRKSANVNTKLNRNCLNSYEKVEDFQSSSDPSALKELMSEDQRNFEEELESNQSDRFSRELTEKIQKKLEKEKLNKRNVSEFLRVKIVDLRKPDFNNPAILSVWNPNEDLTALLSEGKVISLMNVTISNSSRIYKPLQINTTRQTQYRQIIRSVKYPERKLTRLKDVSLKVCPAFEEVDLVGMVALIRDVAYGSRMSQIIYLTDLETHFVGIVFWGSCKDYGWENVLRTPSVVACSNLQWKKNYTPQDVPSLYVNENSVFTENPKQVYLKEEIERLRQSMPGDKNALLSKCEEDLTTKLENSKWQMNNSKNSSANDSGIRESSLKPQVVNGFESRPTASSTPIKPFSGRKEGSDEAEPSPIQKRIEKLQSYGEPPSLIPLLIRNNERKKLKKKG